MLSHILIYIIISFNNSIKNGVYNLVFNDLYLDYHNKYISISDNFAYPNTFFRITKKKINTGDYIYNLEQIITNLKLSYLESNGLIFDKKTNNSENWFLIKTNENNYLIRNYNKCYIKLEKSKITCEFINDNDATKFKIIKLFIEKKKEDNIKNIQLINKEPVDVLIKYIDLSDSSLKRNGIHQIQKDFDNEELRYSIRSILNYIPWVRKIFILMPNEKVRYFKEYYLIKEKIIYVKDKDLLGYESSNSNAFQFRYWKMKKYGISDNIIAMDDDYFIGHKLEKTDFFYVKKGKVVPSIITSNFVKIDKKSSLEYREFYKLKAKFPKEEQNNDQFSYSKYLTFVFILDIFNIPLNQSIYIPKFSHNAIPMNLNDIKEVYDYVYSSEYKYTTLDCPFRDYEYLQFQILVVSYTFLKYNRKVNNIPYKFIQLNDSISVKYNAFLFCINKGAGNYSYLSLYKAKIAMEYIFPFPTKYEIIDYSILKYAFNVTYSMDKIEKEYGQSLSNTITKNEFYFLLSILLINFISIILKLTTNITYLTNS